MKGLERRDKILSFLKEASTPLTASFLAENLGVSRQIIVQDVALLRAENYPILSTNQGYVYTLSEKKEFKRVFKVFHSDEDIEKEMLLIVNLGGIIQDVFVNHRIYGKITAQLNISNPLQVAEYIRSITAGSSRPLKSVTDGYHYHTVIADSEKTLDLIEKALKESGFLIEK